MAAKSICYANERHALIIGYSQGEKLVEVNEDIKLVEAFVRRQHFTSITILRDQQVTSEAVNQYFEIMIEKCS